MGLKAFGMRSRGLATCARDGKGACRIVEGFLASSTSNLRLALEVNVRVKKSGTFSAVVQRKIPEKIGDSAHADLRSLRP